MVDLMHPHAPRTWQYSQVIPPNTNWVGQTFYLQGFAYAPGANVANIVTSNGIKWEIGDVSGLARAWPRPRGRS